MKKVGAIFGMLVALLCASAAPGGDEVILKSRRFVPAVGVSASLRGRQSGSSERIHVIIQMENVPTVERRVGFIRTGVRLLSYLPQRSWLAGVRADKLDEIAALAGVRAVVEIEPEDKLAPPIAAEGVGAYALTDDGRARLTVLFFEDVTPAAGVRAIRELGGTVVDGNAAENGVLCHVPVTAIEDLASCEAVKWIDQLSPSMDLNDGVRAAININAVQMSPYGLTGAGVIIGQWESKHPDKTHGDLSGRVVNIDDAWPVGDHATQVAGTMVGNGSLLASRQYRGIATDAAIVSYHSWDSVSELRDQYRNAIEMYDIDIANNSWGKVEWHVYKDYAAALDAIVRGALGKPISMAWAAGNEGGWATILCTGVAKNVVTVGATNSDDDSVWPWSNKGPTEDGRIKPDVVAPGCEADDGEVWSTLPSNRYGGACGTSLAAPSVSGTMALILEDWCATHGSDPQPATIKAVLLHTARDLGTPGPDYVHGYGLIDGRKSIDLVRADAIDDTVVEDRLMQQGQRDLYTVTVAPGASELKLTLVWDDWPADPLAAHALVNDLDLVVTGPDGTRHYPWTLDPYLPAEPAQRVRADHTNNVEQVCVEQPAPGTWLVTVWAADLPQYDQPYSLAGGGTGFTAVPSGTAILGIVGYLGQTVAEFDDGGNLVLQGALTTETECEAPAGAFVIKGPQQEVVGYIDLDGNMCIRGELNELAHCEAGGGGFAVRDWFGNIVARVDLFGNLCLAGRLHQNPLP